MIHRVEHTNSQFTPIDLCRFITQYCNDLTKNGRDFLSQNAKQRIPDDPVAYPGKMDHCSVVVIKVGKIQ